MFGKATQIWFDETFAGATEIQRRGWEAINRGDHALLVAPTGSGKTLAAFLAGIDALAQNPSESRGTRVLYISPLKALVYDIERNLRAPLVGIQRAAERLDMAAPRISVAVRTGDTPSRDRQRQLRTPGDILVTTPESLFLLLGSRARENLRSVETVILDEVHALAPTKRGSHLALSFERLSEIADKDPQRIGLSATVRPLDEVARYLGGDRAVEIVDASRRPALDLLVTVPVPDMTNIPVELAEEPGKSRTGQLKDRHADATTPERGIWAAIYPKLVEEIRANRSTIIFTNSRGICERLTRRLNELAGEELVLAHHGSVSHEKRAEIEEGLKAGEIRGIVATSSLELGIDMGAVDRVLLIESPGSVARGLQRVGRAGHQVGETSVGRIFPKFRGDLLESAVIASLMREGELETTRIPHNALDVLAQQIVAMCVDTDRTRDEIATLIKRAYPFHQITPGVLDSVLDMLSGRYPSSDFADLRPLLAWDRTNDLLKARRGAPMVSRMNAGTIPDRGNYGVHIGVDGPRIGELDEEMVFETQTGEHIVLGATTWRVEEVTRDRVVVTPAPGEQGRLPFWRGEGPGRPIEVGRAIGRFLRKASTQRGDRLVNFVARQTPLDRFAAENLAAYIKAQREHCDVLPTDRQICVERFRDELGDWRVCILTPFGARLHAPWAMAIQHQLSSANGFETQLMYSEDGIVLRFADTEELPEVDQLFPDPDEIEDLLTAQLSDTAMFAGLFRENAVRSLLMPRRRPTQRSPLWAQRLKAQQLLATVRNYPAFPMVLETYRQAMRDVFDLPALRTLLRDIRSREILVHEVETPSASPFARSLVFAYVAAYMYEQDSPIAERRAQALSVDRALLGELLGQEELRELIDRDVLIQMELELQHLADNRKARDADELQDLLRRLGDLTPAEIEDRSVGDPRPWLKQLEHERRAVSIAVAGDLRWIAAEDAGLYRDALGCMPPAGLPDAYLSVVDQPLEQIVRRFARHHGPFLLQELAGRYRLATKQLEPTLTHLEQQGVLVRGEIRPGGVATDICDAEVLRRLKRRTLALLRREVAPVDARTLGTFLPQWHGIATSQPGSTSLLDAVAQLEGVALPWTDLADVVFPQRVPRFTLDQLDALCASGAVVWVGRGALGARNGRVSLYLRAHAAALVPKPNEDPHGGAVQATILRVLSDMGASFQSEIQSVVLKDTTATTEEFHAALWDLVWNGYISNDTLAPLHQLRRPARRMPPRRMSGRRRTPLRNPVAGGRWSLVGKLVRDEVSDTERALARAQGLLERYGVVSREAAHAEDIVGGFTSIYKVLRAMEEAGQVRRGYFVEGLSGAQFAHAGAVDRLRASRPDEDGDERWTAKDVVMTAAVDPANPYGSLLPWPENEHANGARPRRISGAWVLMLGGYPVLWVGPGGRQLLTFPIPGRPAPESLAAAFAALERLPGAVGKRRLLVQEVDGQPVSESRYLTLMRDCGFANTYRGLEISRSSSA